jgi:hypothetical protein
MSASQPSNLQEGAVTRATETRPNAQMDMVGYLVAVPLLLIALPLLPVLVLLWIVAKLLGR